MGVPIEKPSVPPVLREEDAIVGSEPQVTINETVSGRNPQPAIQKVPRFRTPHYVTKKGGYATDLGI